jgi:hypothetical protein
MTDQKIRERLERVRHLREAGLTDRLLAIGANTAPRLREPWRPRRPPSHLCQVRV